MTFEQFTEVVRDWQNRLTPEQARSAAASLLLLRSIRYSSSR
jgi:hypothetical protein